MPDAAIRTEGLTKRFGDTLAVDQLDLDVVRGEIFGFLGPNGAGKTTTIRMLLSLLRPTAGRAWITGIPGRPRVPRRADRSVPARSRPSRSVLLQGQPAEDRVDRGVHDPARHPAPRRADHGSGSADGGGIPGTGGVVLGVDGSEASTAATGFAFEAASVRGLPVTVVHAVWDPYTESQAVVAVLSDPQRVVVDDSELLDVAETIAGWRERFPDVKLLVVGARGRESAAVLLPGSVSRQVLKRAHCPVAVVRSQPRVRSH